MLKQTITIAFFCIALNTFGQNKTEPKQVVPNLHLSVFEQAKVLGDVNTVISSLNYLIASEPQKYASYADTLAQVYLNAGYYIQSNNLSSILLQKTPNKEVLMAIKAVSLRELNQIIPATDLYAKLYEQTQKYAYGIELVQLQLTLQRLPECQITVNKLLGEKFKEDEKLNVPLLDNKSTQAIAPKAFIHYIQALAFNAAKEKDKAIEAIEKALSIEKDFALANATLQKYKSNEAAQEAQKK